MSDNLVRVEVATIADARDRIEALEADNARLEEIAQAAFARHVALSRGHTLAIIRLPWWNLDRYTGNTRKIAQAELAQVLAVTGANDD